MIGVSIHASVKDATKTDNANDHEYRVSIHASVKDATIKVSAYPFRAYVSIHASVKDATDVRVFSQRPREFQSTHL